MNNVDKIIDYLSRNQASVNEIAEYLSISRQALHRILNKLMADGTIVKIGSPPKVYYSLPTSSNLQVRDTTHYDVSNEIEKLIEDNFLYITSFGRKESGLNGFIIWCTERKQDISKMAKLYNDTMRKYESYRESGLINGMVKMRSTFNDVALDEIFYLDFYSIEIFGKTKLGQLLLFAKQSQDKVLMDQLISSIRPDVVKVIEMYSIDGIGFIPPTVKRERQLMKQVEKTLDLPNRTVSLVKVKTPVIIPQKTLNKLEDRVINARETIVVDDLGVYDNILLIDDAVGSGATLNEVAKKIRQKGICKGKIIGLAITGSVKGFDVISEV